MSTRILLFIVLLFIWPNGLTASEVPLQIIFYSGNPEIQTEKNQGGLPALATLIKRSRDQNGPVLFIHGGRAIAPSTLSSFDRGTHMIDLLNQLNPIAFNVGKSEFAFREDELTLRSKEASFPMLSANIFDPITGGPPEGIKPSLIHRVHEFNIGIFSITHPELMQDYILDRVTILDINSTIKNTAGLLRAQGADLVIMVSDHKPPHTPQLLEENTVDLMLISEKTKEVTQDHDSIQIVHGRTDDAVMLDATLKRTNNTFSWEFKYTLKSLGNIPPDPSMQKTVNGYVSQLARFLEIEIGVTQTELDTRKEVVRTAENAFGNIVADSIRSFFKADIGLMNSGGIRGNRIYPPGTTLTRGDMLREIPFRNYAVQIEVTGKQLIEALENGFSRIEDIKGCFPHVSGMTITYAPEAEPYNRIRSVMVGDNRLDPKKIYRLATVNFLADGGDGYSTFKNCKRLDKFGGSRLLWEYARDYIADRKQIAPVIEGRILTVSE